MRRKILLAVFSSLVLIGCSGGGEVGKSISSSPPPPPSSNPSKPTYLIAGNTLYSMKGLASLTFKNAVVMQRLGGFATNRGSVQVVTTHNGTSLITLNVSDPDSPFAYLYAQVNGTELPQHPYFSLNSGGVVVTLNGFDYVNNQTFTNSSFVKITITSGTGTLKYSFSTGGNAEGQTFTVNPYRLYNLINQGGNTVLDLGDYFTAYKIYFNRLPDVQVVGTSSCPVNGVDTNNDSVIDLWEIPPYPNGFNDCISIAPNNVDGIGYNISYSTDGTNFSPFNNPTNINLTISQGQTLNKTIWVREYIDPATTIPDTIDRVVTVRKENDLAPGTSPLGVVCHDNQTNFNTSISDGGSCTFVDPGNNSVAGTITVSGVDVNYGNCYVRVQKDGSDVFNSSVQPCNNISVTYTVNASDRGTGNHSLSFGIYKLFSTGTGNFASQIDQVDITYLVNQAPTVSGTGP